MSVRFKLLGAVTLIAVAIAPVSPVLAQQANDNSGPGYGAPPPNDNGADNAWGYSQDRPPPPAADDRGPDDRSRDGWDDRSGPGSEYRNSTVPPPLTGTGDVAGRPNYGSAAPTPDVDAPPPPPPSRDDWRERGYQRDRAADLCANAAEREAYRRGDDGHVEDVTRVERENGEWRVEGHMWSRRHGPGSFACGIRNGEVRYVQIAVN